MVCFQTIEKVEDFLYNLRNAGSKFSLDRVSRLVECLGSPEKSFAKIHIAGTNGKGSVCAMIESILTQHGLKVGMFTSPHLVYLGERVQICRQPISKSDLLKTLSMIRCECDKIFDNTDLDNYPSFFEYMTALAFCHFKSEKIDCAVVEVGLGGRLDSTNIIEPEISVISSIGLDHIQILGSSIEQIAMEKAGIIKEGVPVVCGILPDEAMAVIEKVAKQKNAKLYKLSDYYPSDDSYVDTSLYGYYQKRNASLALLVVNILRERALVGVSYSIFENISQETSLNALQKVKWSARWEEISLKNEAKLILDASHNEEGALNLESNLKSMDFSGGKPIIAVGVLGQDRAIPLLQVVKKYAKKIILLMPNQPRATSFDVMRSELVDCDVEIVDSKVSDIFKSGNICTLVEQGETIISTGSIYLAGEILSAISGSDNDNLQDIINA